MGGPLSYGLGQATRLLCPTSPVAPPLSSRACASPATLCPSLPSRPVPPPLPQEMRALFTRLRQSCGHPQLVKEREELHGRGLLSLAEIMANLVKEVDPG